MVTFWSTSQAQVSLDRVGQTTMNFQLVSLSARASGLGEAVYASSIGSEAIFYNPAGLAEIKKQYDASIMYTAWIADINYVGGSVAWKAGDIGVFGISAMHVSYGTIRNTRLLGSASPSEDVAYEDLGNMNNLGAYSFGVSYARSITTNFLLGGTMRYTGQNLGESMLSDGLHENNAAKLVFDIGVKYYTGLKSFRFAMAFRNFSTQVKREKISEQMPVLFTMGTAFDLLDVLSPQHTDQQALTLTADYVHPNNYSERMNLGLEYITMGMFVARAGYQTNRDLASWSTGFGFFTTVKDYDLQFNYSYSPMEYFTSVSRFSLGFGF